MDTFDDDHCITKTKDYKLIYTKLIPIFEKHIPEYWQKNFSNIVNITKWTITEKWSKIEILYCF
jgi:hypothetical protein